MSTATGIDCRITMADGVDLAATLYLPDAAAAPCLLEALPYRKDDVTSSLRVRIRTAARRVRLRGLPPRPARHRIVRAASRPTSTRPASRTDLVAVIAWLAEQPWCTGSVGMYGTSYSGFNSIQVAMHRPPALKAIIPIYATDDRYTDDVHYMGGVRRLLDIVDYPTYMIAMNALPPVPAVFGDGWRDEWRRRIDETAAVAAALDRGGRRRRLLAARLAAAGLPRDHRAHDDRRRAGPTAIATTRSAPTRADRGRHPDAAADRAVEPQVGRVALPGPHVDLCREMARWFDRWLRGVDNGIGAYRRPAASRASSTSPATRRPPSPDAAVMQRRLAGRSSLAVATIRRRRHARSAAAWSPTTPIAGTGTAAWNSCAGALPYGQPTDQRLRRRRVADLGLAGRRHRELLGHARLRLRADRRSAGRHGLGEAHRRRTGRHLHADHPGPAEPDAPMSMGPERCRSARSSTSRSSSRRPRGPSRPGHRLRLVDHRHGLAEHDRRTAPVHADRSTATPRR